MAVSVINATDFLVPAEILRGEIEQEVTSAKLLTYPSFTLFQKKSAFQTSIDWPVGVGGGNATGRALTDAVVASNQDKIQQATLPIGNRIINHVFSVTLNDVTQAARTAPAALRNLFQGHIKSGVENILRKLNQDILLGDGTNASDGVFGLGYAIDNTKVYAGLDPAVYPLWTTAINTNATARALSTAQLIDIEAQLVTKGGYFTHLVCSPTAAANYKKLFTPVMYQNAGEGAGTLNAGYTGLQYAGRDVIQDPDCPNDRVYFVNASDVSVVTFNQSGAIQQLDIPTMVMDVEGLNMMIAQMPRTNPYMVQFEMSIQPQVKIQNKAKSIAAVLQLNG